MIKYWLISAAFACTIGFTPVHAQVPDTNAIKNLYDQSLDYSDDRIDSLKLNARLIEEAAQQLDFIKGFILANRLKGLAEEYAGNYEEAIFWYLKTLNDARTHQFVEYEIAALSDLAITYSEVKQYEKAKDVYRQSLQLSMKRGEVSNIISGLGNLGAIYNLLNKPDSALLFLEEGLRLSTAYNTSETLPTLYNNLGNVYFKKKDFRKALQYFSTNKHLHQSPDQLGNLWTDYLNIGDVYIELGQMDSARFYCEEALRVSRQLNSRPKEAESYSLLAKFYERQGNYRKAFEFQQLWYQMDTALVNQNTTASIAEMQERYNAKDREAQNRLLQAAVEHEKLNNRNLRSLSLAAILIVVLISISLIVYRRSNKQLLKVNAVINRQKESLSLLNQEKNTLISIVSHDLSTPFSSIHMWSRLLESDNTLDADQKKATENIRRAAENGEQLIRHILEVEKAGTGSEKLELEEINLPAFVQHLVEQFQPAAKEKAIELSGPDPSPAFFLLTDQSLLKRILDNLLSNALKFSGGGQQVSVQIQTNHSSTAIIVADTGPGISTEDQQRLFTKYGQLSARPTGGEASTGLGLAIVKRLANELNATLQYEGDAGAGSRFIIRFKK